MLPAVWHAFGGHFFLLFFIILGLRTKPLCTRSYNNNIIRVEYVFMKKKKNSDLLCLFTEREKSLE